MAKIEVEVFKTNVQRSGVSIKIINELKQIFPTLSINFDLEDCDKILRVEGENIIATEIIQFLIQKGYGCEILPEN